MHKRKIGIEGIEDLFWPEHDTGAFGFIQGGIPMDGPICDWYDDKSHFLSQVKNFGTVVQAGGNCGMYPRFYEKYFDRVYTFEPDPVNYSYLEANCKDFPNIHSYEYALGSNVGRASMIPGPLYNVGMHKIKPEPGGDVKMVTLDSLKLKSCDLIHYDLEEFEEEALQGSLQTIKKFSPVVITENAGGRFILMELGYEVYRRCRMDTIFIKK